MINLKKIFNQDWLIELKSSKKHSRTELFSFKYVHSVIAQISYYISIIFAYRIKYSGVTICYNILVPLFLHTFHPCDVEICKVMKSFKD